METTVKKLQAIYNRFNSVVYNEANYFIGGGLSETKFASRRHEDAKADAGKVTLGEAVQLFKKATGLDTQTINEAIKLAIPHMEWHHAGRLPKNYGGGMKKTYFLNADDICYLASNWQEVIAGVERMKQVEIKQKSLQERRNEFLELHAKKVERVTTKPKFFYQTKQEMRGKYGWFDSSHKSYNLPEYYSGWEFESEELYNEFLNIR